MSIPVTIFNGDIAKPMMDDREYEIITLANKLTAILISDPACDRSAASLDVNVGSLSDTTNLDGLAHFCEHLLFMGTEKYPNENEYSQFLSMHGGRSNAFTSADHTNFYFDVSSDFLEHALDMFAEFFKTPLFDNSCTERELNAVDSEHKKNIFSDMWRSYQILKDNCSKSHPYSRFATGNLKTLKEVPESLGINTRDELIKFHDKYYSANIMKLAVVGKESLPELRAWVIEKFSGIKNLDIDVPYFPLHPMPKEDLPKLIKIKTVKEMRTLVLLFPCDNHEKDYDIKPFDYISHLIGHEGPGSILSLLKDKGLAQSLSAGLSGLGAADFGFFKISIELTIKGLECYEDILEIVYQYLIILKTSGIKEWIFNECRAINEFNFKFKEKFAAANDVSRLAANLHKYRPADILYGQYKMENYDENLLKSCVDYLNVDNMIIKLENSGFQVTPDWETEEFYDAKYCTEPINAELVQKLKFVEKDMKNLSLPDVNPFIPENLSLQSKITDNPEIFPKIIEESNVLRIWHKLDDTFLIPRAFGFISISTPLAYESVESALKTQLFVDLLKDSVNEFSYFAEVAGLKFSLENISEGIVLNVYGYSDKFKVLLAKLVEKMKNFTATEANFERLKDRIKKKLLGWFAESPHKHAVYYFCQLTQERLFTHSLKLEALKTITLNEVHSFAKQLLSHCYIEAFVAGNITREEGLSFVHVLTDALKPEPLPTGIFRLKTVIAEPGSSVVYNRVAHNDQESNSVIEYAIQVGSVSNPDLRTKLGLLASIAQEPAFNILRTQEQLGYIVHCTARKQTEMISLRFLVQSERDPMYLEKRIESFLVQLRQILVEMSLEHFEKHKAAIISKLKESIKSLSEETRRMWAHITSGYYDFNQNLNDVELVSILTKESMLEFFDSYISANSPTRRKLAVHIKCGNAIKSTETETGFPNECTVLDNDSVEAWRASMQVTGIPLPAINLEALKQ